MIKKNQGSQMENISECVHDKNGSAGLFGSKPSDKLVGDLEEDLQEILSELGSELGQRIVLVGLRPMIRTWSAFWAKLNPARVSIYGLKSFLWDIKLFFQLGRCDSAVSYHLCLFPNLLIIPIPDNLKRRIIGQSGSLARKLLLDLILKERIRKTGISTV